MPVHHMSVVDAEHRSSEPLRFEEKFQKDGVELPVKFTKRRLAGGLSDGVETLDVDNGLFSFTVLLSKGMGPRVAAAAMFLKWDSR